MAVLNSYLGEEIESQEGLKLGRYKLKVEAEAAVPWRTRNRKREKKVVTCKTKKSKHISSPKAPPHYHLNHTLPHCHLFTAAVQGACKNDKPKRVSRPRAQPTKKKGTHCVI